MFYGAYYLFEFAVDLIILGWNFVGELLNDLKYLVGYPD